MGGKRGSIAEAALVFPIVILAMVSLIYLMINMYGITAYKAARHVALRQYADGYTGLTSVIYEEGTPKDVYGAKAWNMSAEIYSEHGDMLKLYAADTESMSLRGGGLLLSGRYESESVSNIVNETEYMRWADLFVKEKER